jgi:hypothetical protein
LHQKYKSEKISSKSDEIRLKLSELGVTIEDKPMLSPHLPLNNV